MIKMQVCSPKKDYLRQVLNSQEQPKPLIPYTKADNPRQRNFIQENKNNLSPRAAKTSSKPVSKAVSKSSSLCHSRKSSYDPYDTKKVFTFKLLPSIEAEARMKKKVTKLTLKRKESRFDNRTSETPKSIFHRPVRQALKCTCHPAQLHETSSQSIGHRLPDNLLHPLLDSLDHSINPELKMRLQAIKHTIAGIDTRLTNDLDDIKCFHHGPGDLNLPSGKKRPNTHFKDILEVKDDFAAESIHKPQIKPRSERQFTSALGEEWHLDGLVQQRDDYLNYLIMKAVSDRTLEKVIKARKEGKALLTLLDHDASKIDNADSPSNPGISDIDYGQYFVKERLTEQLELAAFIDRQRTGFRTINSEILN